MAEQPHHHADGGGEEVLAHLELAERAFETQQQKWEGRIQQVEGALDAAREQNRELGRHLETLQRSLESEQERADRHRKRMLELAELVKHVHQALFEGNVQELILRACLTISGATRGLYLSWRGGEDRPHVRAAVGIDGYPESAPSDFITALAQKVIEDRDTLVCNDLETLLGTVPPPGPGERFRNCAAAPTVMRRGFDGVVLVADKKDGSFDEEDLEALLSVGDQATVALENVELQRELQSAYVSTIAMLADAVEAKDPYTHGHCEEASRQARRTAERLGLSDREISVVCYAALLHDVGKIGVSDGVLHKPGPLLPEERELVRAHVRVGHDLLRHVPALESVANAVLHHHEWFDGNGYPDGLQGDQIPMASRVISVVDAFGAMTTKRSYKEAYTTEHAREELTRFAGMQFDPEVVDAFLDVLDAEATDGAPECGPLPDFPNLRRTQEAWQ